MRILCFSMAALLMGAATQAGQITGQVINQSSQPIPWIFLDVYDADGNYFDYSYSDENGDYVVPNLGQGTFYVRTYTFGAYVDEWYDNVDGAQESLTHDPIGAGATPVEVPLLWVADNINFTLVEAATITGRVTRAGSGNNPITNIYVDACLADGTRFQSGVTSQNGNYGIDGLPPGAYSVRTDAGSDGVDTWQDDTEAFNEISPADAGVATLNLSAGQTRSGVNFSLDPAATLGGTLQHTDGAPVSGTYVDFYDSTGTRLEYTRSNADGTYALTGLPAGSYFLGLDSLGSYIDLWYNQRLMVDPDDPVTDGADAVALASAQVRTNILFALNQGASLSGRITDHGGSGIADVFVDAFLEGIFLDFAVTGSDGSFTLPALPDGTYYLKADAGGRYRNEWYPDQPVYDVDDPVGDGAGAITVTNGISVSNLVVALAPGADISGAVTIYAGGPIGDCYVDLHNAEGRRLFYTRTNSNGVYRLGGLPPGSYYLGTDSSGQYVDEWYAGTILVTATNPVADAAQALVLNETTSLTNINFALREGGSISGVVTGPGDTNLVDCAIDLYRGTNYFGWTLTDSNGVYQADTLPAGTWYLRTDNGDELVNEWYGDAYIYHLGLPEEDGAASVILADDQNRDGIDFFLGLGADIEGSVHTTVGSPLSGMFIDFYDFSGRHYDFAVTDTNGNYHLELMPPGTWYVGTETFGEYLDRWFENAVRDFYSDPVGDGATPVLLEDGIVLIGVDLKLGLSPDSLFVVEPAEPGTIEWPGETNQTYQVQRCEYLPSGNWTNAPSGAVELEHSFKPAGDAGLRQYRDPAPPPGGASYRITN